MSSSKYSALCSHLSLDALNCSVYIILAAIINFILVSWTHETWCNWTLLLTVKGSCLFYLATFFPLFFTNLISVLMLLEIGHLTFSWEFEILAWNVCKESLDQFRWEWHWQRRAQLWPQTANFIWPNKRLRQVLKKIDSRLLIFCYFFKQQHLNPTLRCRSCTHHSKAEKVSLHPCSTS